MAENDREHLGDGVIVTHDGRQLKLVADGTNTVYVEPAVLLALIRYAVHHDVIRSTDVSWLAIVSDGS